jgi:hypothetical protein
MGRTLSLLAVLLVGNGLAQLLSREGPPASPQVPTDDAVYQLAGWEMGPLEVHEFTDPEPGAILQRAYQHGGGTTARLVVWIVPQPYAKTLLRKGPDRDFLGVGYLAEAAPAAVASPAHGSARILRRGDETWLLFSVYGERRGLLGERLPDQARAWVWAGADALLDRPNQYFMARLQVPLSPGPTSADPMPAAPPATMHPTQLEPTRPEATRLAEVLFTRLAGWYTDLGSPR